MLCMKRRAGQRKPHRAPYHMTRGEAGSSEHISGKALGLATNRNFFARTVATSLCAILQNLS
jgi:hypothetical protein